MGKKSKLINVKLIYQAINDNIHKENYRQAVNLIRKTKFPPAEKKKIDQLNVEVHFFWALAYFKQRNYTQAISTLRMFTERYKNKIKLPQEKINTLIGLCYLYLHNSEKATEYLKESIVHTATRSFGFYYLLTLIYQEKYKSYDDLLANYQKWIEELPVNRQQYLKVAFALVQENYAKAESILKGVDSSALVNQKDILALQSILQNKTYDNNSTELKPLYKSLLKLSLTEEEAKYLASIPQMEAISKAAKQRNLTHNFKDSVKRLCEEGNPLTDIEFTRCMEMPEAFRPYLVYNQIAALFNEDLEEKETEILQVLRKYEWYYFQVPESLLLFTQIVYWDPENFTSNYFWKIIESGLDRFGQSFTPLQLNRLSWRIYGCLEYGDLKGGKSKDDKQAYKIVAAYPQMLGLKLWRIMDYIFAPKMELSDSNLDIFTSGNFQYGSEIAKNKLDESLSEVFSFSDIVEDKLTLMMDFGEGEHGVVADIIRKMYKETLFKLLRVLIDATTKFEVHLKNRGVLDFFFKANEFMRDIYIRDKIEPEKAQKNAFREAYHQLLVRLEEDKPASIYFKDYQSLL